MKTAIPPFPILPLEQGPFAFIPASILFLP